MRAENVNDSEFGYSIDGTNKTFVVKNFPVVPGGFSRVVADNTVTTNFTPTESTGQLVMTTPPATSLYVSYYFQLFSDAVWTEFVTFGMQQINLSGISESAATDVPNVPEGLIAALKTYINATFCRRVAQQTGLWYNQRLQERVEDRNDISNKWLKLAESAQKLGDAQRMAYYTGSGAESSPAFRIGGFQPRPWTPVR